MAAVSLHSLNVKDAPGGKGRTNYLPSTSASAKGAICGWVMEMQVHRVPFIMDTSKLVSRKNRLVSLTTDTACTLCTYIGEVVDASFGSDFKKIKLGTCGTRVVATSKLACSSIQG